MDNRISQKRHTVSIPGMLTMRCDQYISQIWKLCTRSQLRLYVFDLQIDDIPSKFSQKIRTGQQLKLYWKEIVEEKLLPENIKFEVLYEDHNVWVINKPAGLIVHPGVGHKTGTLVNALIFRSEFLTEQFPNNTRAGIVHRLDCDTSGVMICSKNISAHEFLLKQFRERTITKSYLALCYLSKNLPKNFEDRGVIKNYIFRSPVQRKQFICGLESQNGKLAITEYLILEKKGDQALVFLKPYTGRTHQLRVHMKYKGIPILGDPIYNINCKFMSLGLMLHSWKLQFVLPSTGKSVLFTSDLPERFYRCWEGSLLKKYLKEVIF